MSAPIITVENLSKAYRIGLKEQIPDTLVAAATSWLKAPLNNLRRLRRLNTFSGNGHADEDIIWALKDVSFDVQEGEVLGIIGRNGAGKSTLLKILSRITEPTGGRAIIRGRVSSLLEVGTGFHPELTGRENIYMNGTILGMTKREIDRKFDEIVDFSGVEQFLDTPIKRYSSGMQVRLAFSVAAHLEPEILIIDEVLAVGDVEFQKKCLGKMNNVATQGRTVLFVSHNMAALQSLCPLAMVIDRGHVTKVGGTESCIQSYLSEGMSQTAAVADLSLRDLPGRRGTGQIRFLQAEILDAHGRPAVAFMFRQPFRVRLTVSSEIHASGVILGFSFIAMDGVEVQGTVAHDGGLSADIRPGTHVLECRIDPMILTPRRYILRGAIFRRGVTYDHVDTIAVFDVLKVSADLAATPSTHQVGYVYLPYSWRVVYSDAAKHRHDPT